MNDVGQTTIEAADKFAGNFISVLADVFTQPASAYAMFISFGCAYVYSLFADDNLSLIKRRKIKSLISFTISCLVFLSLCQGAVHKEEIVTSVSVGFASILLPLLIIKLLEAYAPKLAQVIEPDEKRSRKRKVSNDN